MLRTNKSGVFSCPASILLFSRSQFREAATFPWIWTVWLKLPPIVTKEFVRGSGIGFCCSRESMCVKYYGNSGQYSPEREILHAASFCIFPYRQILTEGKIASCNSTVALLDTFDILHDTKVSYISNFGASNQHQFRKTPSFCKFLMQPSVLRSQQA